MKTKVETKNLESITNCLAQKYVDRKILIKIWTTEDDREYGEPDIISADDLIDAFKEVQYLVKNNDFQCLEIYADNEIVYYQDNFEQYFLIPIAND